MPWGLRLLDLALVIGGMVGCYVSLPIQAREYILSIAFAFLTIQFMLDYAIDKSKH